MILVRKDMWTQSDNEYLDPKNIEYLQVKEGGVWHIQTRTKRGKSQDSVLCGVYFYSDNVHQDRIIELPNGDKICKNCARLLEKLNIDIVQEPSTSKYSSLPLLPAPKVNIDVAITGTDGNVNMKGAISKQTASKIIDMIKQEVFDIPPEVDLNELAKLTETNCLSGMVSSSISG